MGRSRPLISTCFQRCIVGYREIRCLFVAHTHRQNKIDEIASNGDINEKEDAPISGFTDDDVARRAWSD